MRYMCSHLRESLPKCKALISASLAPLDTSTIAANVLDTAVSIFGNGGFGIVVQDGHVKKKRGNCWFSIMNGISLKSSVVDLIVAKN